jgi:transposase
MRFVPVKNIEQQAILSVHRAREGFVKERTAQANQIRGLLAEYGVALPIGISHITKDVPKIVEDGGHDLPGSFQQLIMRLVEHFKALDQQVDELEGLIKQWHRENDASCKLAEIPGIGPITASALAASVGDAKTFKNGRQLAAWLGLVPRQHSTGGKSTLLGISKRGDCYLRTLLIHGARSVVRVAQAKTELTGSWLQALLGRRNANVATVALANKNARIAWALLANNRRFQSNYAPAVADA